MPERAIGVSAGQRQQESDANRIARDWGGFVPEYELKSRRKKATGGSRELMAINKDED